MLVLGCADILQQDSINPNANTSEIFFQTEQDAISSINACYNALIVDGFYNRMGLVMADARSDELGGRSPWDVLSTVGNFVLTCHQWSQWLYLGSWLYSHQQSQPDSRRRCGYGHRCGIKKQSPGSGILHESLCSLSPDPVLQ